MILGAGFTKDSVTCSRSGSVLKTCNSPLSSSLPKALVHRASSTAAMASGTTATDKERINSHNGASISAERFIRPHLLKLAPYTPIEPFEVLSERMGRLPKDIVKLDANENPYGAPKEVLEALGSMPFPNIYPDPETRRLRAALAEYNDIPIEHLLVGNPI